MKRYMVVLWMCVGLMACGEESTPVDAEGTTQSPAKGGKGDVIDEQEERFGNVETDGALTELAVYLMQEQGLLMGASGDAALGEAGGISCVAFGADSSCALRVDKFEVIGGSFEHYTYWFEGEGATTLYTWMSERFESDESITAGVFATGDEYTRGPVTCAWSTGSAPTCYVSVGDEGLVTRSQETLARVDEGFLVVNGALASGVGAVLEEAGLTTEMPKIDLKVAEASGVRCSYDLDNVPMCEFDPSYVELYEGSGLSLGGDVATELYTIMGELEEGGSKLVERRFLASGEELSTPGLSCSWTSGSAPSCIID